MSLSKIIFCILFMTGMALFVLSVIIPDKNDLLQKIYDQNKLIYAQGEETKAFNKKVMDDMGKYKLEIGEIGP